MENIYIDYSLIEDLHQKGHTFTVSYLFSYMNDEIRKGRKVVLERPVTRGLKIKEIESEDHVTDFYTSLLNNSI